MRPHPKFGTVEVRVMDAVTDVEDAIALAAYVQALVRRYDDGADGRPAIRCWRTRTSGAPRATASTARSSTSRTAARRRSATVIARTLTELVPYARELGCERELAGIDRILRDGNGAARQLAAGGERAPRRA